MRALFTVPSRNDREADAQLLKKTSVKKKAPSTVKGGGGITERIAQIKEMVLKNLGKYEDESVCIQSEMELYAYISKAIKYGEIAIDTETNGLDPMQDDCVGICLYVPNEKTAYVPLNHVSYVTLERVKNQLSVDVVRAEMERLRGTTKIIMFNAAFDIRVLRNQVGVYLTCYWDAYLAARLLNDNEPTNALKPLHKKYCLNGVGDAFTFDSLFRGIPFSKIPINVGYLYAAHDAKITWELYQFQKQYLYYDPTCTFDDRDGMNGVSWTFFNIEMPCLEVVCDMEDNGILLDTEYARVLAVQYQDKLDERLEAFYEECDKIDIAKWKSSHPNKLDDPINISSPAQLSVLLYDIVGLDAGTDKRTGEKIRGTGDEILASLDHPICQTIRDYREVEKLMSTYITKLPECINPNDHRIHCKFNQYGADTGRFSSSDPNLQNIPSHNKDIRKMFVASPGYVLMSSDFSQQEPKCLAALCRKDGDPQMYNTFIEGKDLYSEIASKAFNKPYEECREFDENGNKNPKEYKERRTQAKSILLGVLYGRGTASIGEQLHCSVEKAQEIKDSVFRGFPAIKEFEKSSLDMAKTKGYVTTVCGRKRRLPDLQLDEFEFSWEKGYEPDGDILDFDDTDVEVPDSDVNYYLKKLNKAYGRKAKAEVISEAKRKHIIIKDNGGKIAQATRQCVNARIQGSAADLTKLAMIELNKSTELKELGFRILIPVHDEIIAECPEENAKKCSELLASVMSHAAEEILEMPIKCDVEITRQWYGEAVEV